MNGKEKSGIIILCILGGITAGPIGIIIGALIGYLIGHSIKTDEGD